MTPPNFYHIATKNDVEKAIQNGFYVTESLSTEGFIHCSTREEVIPTANRRFRGQRELILLELEVQKIDATIKFENLSGGSVLYPHIYGKLNWNAVVNTYRFLTVENGDFYFPEANEIVELKFVENYLLKHLLEIFTQQKKLAESAMSQVTDDEFYFKLQVESNCIALIVKHLSGNMISRWTDFLSSDGEKPNRNRDDEFNLHGEDRVELMEKWEQGWRVLKSTLISLTDEDLLKLVYIRGEAHTVMSALLRQVSHYAYHTGQIVYLSKEFKKEAWKSLSIARGKSSEYKPDSKI